MVLRPKPPFRPEPVTPIFRQTELLMRDAHLNDGRDRRIQIKRRKQRLGLDIDGVSEEVL